MANYDENGREVKPSVKSEDKGRKVGYSAISDKAVPMSTEDYWRQKKGFGMPTMASDQERAAWRQNSPTGERTTSDMIRRGATSGDGVNSTNSGFNWQGSAPLASESVKTNDSYVSKMESSGEGQRRQNALNQRGAPQPAEGIIGGGMAGPQPGDGTIGGWDAPSFPTGQAGRDSLQPSDYYSQDSIRSRIDEAKTGSRWTQGVEQADLRNTQGGGRFTHAERTGPSEYWDASKNSKTGVGNPMHWAMGRKDGRPGDEATTPFGQVSVKYGKREDHPKFDRELARTFGYQPPGEIDKKTGKAPINPLTGKPHEGVGFPSGKSEADYNKAFSNKYKTGTATDPVTGKEVPIGTADRKSQIQQTNAINAADYWATQNAKSWQNEREASYHAKMLNQIARKYPNTLGTHERTAFHKLAESLAGGNQ